MFSKTVGDYLSSGRRKSAAVRFMQEASGVSSNDLASAICVTPGSFAVKMHRDSFSWEQLVSIIHACGFKLAVERTDPEEKIFMLTGGDQ